MPCHMQVIAHHAERRFEIRDGVVQCAELETREARPEEALRFQRLIFPLFGQKAQGGLERAEGTFVVSHGKAQPCRGRVCDGELPLDDRILGLLVRRLEHADCASCALDGELDVTDVLADEAEQVQSRRVIGALFEVPVEGEERREEVVW